METYYTESFKLSQAVSFNILQEYSIFICVVIKQHYWSIVLTILVLKAEVSTRAWLYVPNMIFIKLCSDQWKSLTKYVYVQIHKYTYQSYVIG